MISHLVDNKIKRNKLDVVVPCLLLNVLIVIESFVQNENYDYYFGLFFKIFTLLYFIYFLISWISVVYNFANILKISVFTVKKVDKDLEKELEEDIESSVNPSDNIISEDKKELDNKNEEEIKNEKKEDLNDINIKDNLSAEKDDRNNQNNLLAENDKEKLNDEIKEDLVNPELEKNENND
jgi:hypothetical protein